MINIDGNCYPTYTTGSYKATSALPNYARLDVLNFRQYLLEFDSCLVLSGQRFARESSYDHSDCELQFTCHSVTSVRKLTYQQGVYCCQAPTLVRCLTHPGLCLDSEINMLICCNTRDCDRIVEKLYIKKVVKG